MNDRVINPQDASEDFAEYARMEVHPTLTPLVMAHRNAAMALIGEQIFPRNMPVPTKAFKWTRWNVGDFLRVPDTSVGRKSQPPMIDFSGELIHDSVTDYGLRDTIPADDIDQAQGNINPVDTSAMALADFLDLDRERRIAGYVQDSGNYAYNSAVANGDKWNTDGANPVKLINDAMTQTFVTPNTAVMSFEVFAAIRANPFIVSAVQGNDGKSGLVSQKQLADLFGLDNVLIAKSWIDNGKKGQKSTIRRLWGKHFALLYLNSNINDDTPRWSATAEFRTRRTYMIDERPGSVGIDGGRSIVVGESLKEFIPDTRCGYLFENVIA